MGRAADVASFLLHFFLSLFAWLVSLCRKVLSERREQVLRFDVVGAVEAVKAGGARAEGARGDGTEG